MNKRPPIFRIVILLLLAGLAAWYFLVYKRQTHSDHGILSLYGNVDVRQVNLGFQISGRILKMPYEEGSLIKAGQQIAEVDPIPFQQTVNQNVSQAGVQAANLSKLLVGTRVEVIAQDRANVAEREANLKNAEAVLAKNRVAVGIGAVSAQDYQNALTQRNAALAELQYAREVLRQAINGPQPQDIEAARASLNAAKAAASYAQTQLRYVRLFAPADGIVQTRVREPGAVVNIGETVYTLALTSPKWVQTYLEEPDLGRVKPGQKARIFTDTDPKHPFNRQIGYISPVAEFTPKNVETHNLRTELVYPMRVIVTDPENRLRQGMPVTVRINTGIPRMIKKNEQSEP